MTKKRDDDFESARIIEPAPKKGEEPGQIEADIEVENLDDSATEPENAHATHENIGVTDQEVDAADPDVSLPGQTTVSVWQDIIDPLTGKAETCWKAPYTVHKEGGFKGLHKQPLELIVENIKGIFQTGLSHMLLFIGYILGAHYFDNDESKMSSRNRYKDVSVSDLVRMLGGFWTRQMVTDCLNAAFMDMQLRDNDLHLGNLAFDHLRQLPRLKSQKERFKVAKQADKEKWSPNVLKREINHRLGKDKTVPEDKRIVRMVTRQLIDLNRILSDSQVAGILEDKDRLGAALSNKEAGELLDNCKHFTEKLPNSQKTVEGLAKTLVEVQMDKLGEY